MSEAKAQKYDSAQISAAFVRAKNSYAQNTPAQNLMQNSLISMLLEYLQNLAQKSQDSINLDSIKKGSNSHAMPHFERVLELGCGAGWFSQKLAQKISFCEFLGIDLGDFERDFLDSMKNLPPDSIKNEDLIQNEDSIQNAKIFFERADILGFLRFFCEKLDLKSNLDSIKVKKFDFLVSCAALQYCPLREVFELCARALKENGLFLAGFFSEGNLPQIKELCGLSLSYFSQKECEEILLKSGFKILKSEPFLEHLRFESPLALFSHLKNSGANCLKSGFYLSKKIRANCEAMGNCLTYRGVLFLAQKM